MRFPHADRIQSPPPVLRGRVRVGVSCNDRHSTPTPALPRSTGGGGIRSRRGMTFIELMIGMAITAIVAGAIAAGTMAVSTQWNANSGTQSLQFSASQVYARVHHYVSSALYVCQVTP